MTTKTRKPSPAQARKSAAVDAYTKEFGRAPTGRFTAKSLESDVQSRSYSRARMAQQDAMMDRLLVGEKTAKSAKATGATAKAVTQAVVKTPSNTFHGWLDNRYNNRDAAAKVLRDYRASIGRAAPSSISSAMARGQMVPYIGKQMQGLNPYRDNARLPVTIKVVGSLGMGVWATNKIMKGYLFGGMKGAARETVDAATFGFGGKAFNKAFGEADDWNKIAKTFEFETPGQTGARKRADMINKRPTKATRNMLDKVQGRPVQKDVTNPNERHDLRNAGHGIMGLGVGIAGGTATAVLAGKISDGIMAGGKALMGSSATLGVAGKFASRAVPIVALGLGAYTVGSRALAGYKESGASGAFKGAASGALSAVTLGASDAIADFSRANAGFTQRVQSAMPRPASGERHAWDDKARAASIAVRQDKAQQRADMAGL